MSENDLSPEREHTREPHASNRGRPELEFPGRRSFIAVLTAAGAVFVGALLSIPLVVFAFDPLFRKTGEEEWSDAGPAGDFAHIVQPAEPIINVERRDGWRLVMSRRPILVMPHDAGPHRVFSPVCPHLGCQVEWVDNQRHFYCPCHGSIFAEDGSLIEGPAPRGLDYLDSKIEHGNLLVKYQYFRLLVSGREVIG